MGVGYVYTCWLLSECSSAANLLLRQLYIIYLHLHAKVLSPNRITGHNNVAHVCYHVCVWKRVHINEHGCITYEYTLLTIKYDLYLLLPYTEWLLMHEALQYVLCLVPWHCIAAVSMGVILESSNISSGRAKYLCIHLAWSVVCPFMSVASSHAYTTGLMVYIHVWAAYLHAAFRLLHACLQCISLCLHNIWQSILSHMLVS